MTAVLALLGATTVWGRNPASLGGGLSPNSLPASVADQQLASVPELLRSPHYSDDRRAVVSQLFDALAAQIRQDPESRQQIYLTVLSACVSVLCLFLAFAYYHFLKPPSKKDAEAATEKSAPEADDDITGDENYWHAAAKGIKNTWMINLANVLEWYEFSSYGYVAVHITNNFFEGNPLATWLAFALTFLARPFGGAVVGWISDVYGRRIALLISIYGMLIATVGQGLLPTYKQGPEWGRIGMGLLLVLRFIQGLCAGGQLGQTAIFIVERSPKSCIGLMNSCINLGGGLAFCLTSSVVYSMTKALSTDDMDLWGWRVPFVTALIPGIGAIAFQGLLKETHEVEGEKQQPIHTLFHEHRLNLVGAIFTNAAPAAIWYVGSLYAVDYIQEHHGVEELDAVFLGNLSMLVGSSLCPLVGFAVDCIGEGKMLIICCALCAVSGGPAYWLLSTYPNSVEVAYLVIVGLLAILAALGCSANLVVVQMFPPNVRGVGVGVAVNAGVMAFGGLGPSFAEMLHGFIPWGAGLYISFCGVVSLTTMMVMRRSMAQGKINLTYIRTSPY